VGFYFDGGTTQEFSVRVDLDEGTVILNSGTVASFSIVPVGDGWFRVRFTQPNNGTNTAVRFSIRPIRAGAPENTIASNALIWGAQIDLGTVATPYIPTTTAKVESIDVESMGLLIEEQRTNLQIYSQIPASIWVANGTITATDNAAVSPNGTVSATQISTSVSTGGVYQFPGTLTSGITYTYSLFVKAVSGSNTIFFGSDGGTLSLVTVNTLTGAASARSGSPTNITSIPYSNGWYRISFTFTAGATANHSFVIYNLTANANTWLAWGAQVEQGSFPTSYIPTTATSATRSPDIVSIEGTKFSSWFDPLEGTTIVDVENTGTKSNAFSVPIGYRRVLAASSNTIEVFQNNGNF
jgi:hypothetical protein